MKVHAAIARALVDHGVSTVFGLIGDANLFVVDSYVRLGGKYVGAAHEAGAVLMAHGFAATSGQLGVATVTHGPGLTNTVTALVEASRSRSPMLLVCGATAAEARYHLQSIDQREIVATTGAGYEPARSVATVVQDLSIAAQRASVERRPIVFNLPADFQWQETADTPVIVRKLVRQRFAPDPEALNVAAGLIASARRPVVLAGGGASDSRGRSAVLGLAHRIGAPVATTLMAKDLFRDEKSNLGIFGTFTTPAALEVIAASDCIIAFGASLNRWTTMDGDLLEGKGVVHVDLDAARINAVSPVDVGVVSDAAVAADAFVRLLDVAEVPPSGYASDDLALRLKAERELVEPGAGRARTVDVRAALRRIDSALPDDRVVVTDAGRFAGPATEHVHAPDPRSWIYTWRGFGSIGLGLATAVGASYGANGRTTVLVTGDGGFMLGGLAELHSAVRYKRDLVVVVCNDGGYGAEHIQFRDREMDPALALIDWPDFAPVAEALGCDAVTVRCAQDLELMADAIRTRRSPLLIDMKCHPDHMPRNHH